MEGERGAAPSRSPTVAAVGIPAAEADDYVWRRSRGSESAFMENKTHPTGLDDGMPSSSQPSSGYQNNWAAKPGNVSMAYIVKMGKPQGKTSNTSFIPDDMPYPSHNGVVPSMSHQSVSRSTTKVLPAEADVEFHCSQGLLIEDAEVGHELGTTQGQHGDWSPVEESTIHETPYASTLHANLSMSSTLHDDEADLQLNPHVDEIHALEGNIAGHNLPSQSSRFASATDEQIQVDSPEDDFEVIDTLIETMSFYPPQRHVYEHEEVENVDSEISSAAANLLQLRLNNERQAATSAGYNPAVIIPSHLQVTNADCSHWSLGSFGSGISTTFSGSYQSMPLQTNFGMASAVEDTTSLDPSDSRKLEYYDKDEMQYTSNDNVASETFTNQRNYELPSVSQSEIARNEMVDAAHGQQYSLSSVSGYAFLTSTLNTGPYTYPQANQQIQNLAPFSSLMVNPGVIAPPQQASQTLPSTSIPAAVALGYGGFGASANLPEGFSVNPSTTVASALMGFEEALSMQYKQGSQYMHPISRLRTQCGRSEPVRE